MRWSAQIHACFPVAGVTWDAPKENSTLFAYGAVTPYGRPFQTVPLNVKFVKLPPAGWQGRGVPRHRACKPHPG